MIKYFRRSTSHPCEEGAAERSDSFLCCTIGAHLPVRRTLGQIGIPRSTFYRWYDQYQTGGPEALDDRSPRPDRVWNRIPDDVRSRVVTLALDEPELSPRELAVASTMLAFEGIALSGLRFVSTKVGKAWKANGQCEFPGLRHGSPLTTRQTSMIAHWPV